MTTYQPYTYLIGWSQLDKWYYGVRYAKRCSPSDFWVSYFTSSKIVSKYRKLHGEPDVLSIRKTFSDAQTAKVWEHQVLRRLECAKSSKWLNQSNSGENFVLFERTEAHKLKISAALKGKKKTEEHCKNLSKSQRGKTAHNKGKVGYMAGKKLSEEAKLKISQSKIGKNRKMTEEWRQNLRDALTKTKGLKKPESMRKKLGESRRGIVYYHNPLTKEVRCTKDPNSLPPGFVKGKGAKIKI